MIYLLFSLLTGTINAAPIVILQSDKPVLDRPDISVITYVHHNKFRGYHTSVIQTDGRWKHILFKTIAENEPFKHHSYAIYWTMREFIPIKLKLKAQKPYNRMDSLNNSCRFDLYPIQEGEDDAPYM